MEPRRFDQASDRPGPRDGPATGRAIVIEPHLRERTKSGRRAPLRSQRSPEAKLDEAVGLAHAIDLDVVSSGIVPLGDIRPATFVGKGKVEEIAGLVKGEEAGIVVMDCALSPVQQRNLEKAWQAKVLDRTGLILEIFGRRAHTREGSLQVEHAHLTYQKSRLVRSWTHLERQRGGFGFLGGPGESQIETDRRLIEERHRAHRERPRKGQAHAQAPSRQPQARAVSDRGAGRLHQCGEVDAVQPPHPGAACCPPTCCLPRSTRRLRAVDLPHGARIILSDTVGFISDLPTMLVAAFRATLEEVIEADVILHVRDVSHEDAEAQQHDVEDVLRQLGIEAGEGSTA